MGKRASKYARVAVYNRVYLVDTRTKYDHYDYIGPVYKCKWEGEWGPLDKHISAKHVDPIVEEQRKKLIKDLIDGTDV